MARIEFCTDENRMEQLGMVLSAVSDVLDPVELRRVNVNCYVLDTDEDSDDDSLFPACVCLFQLLNGIIGSTALRFEYNETSPVVSYYESVYTDVRMDPISMLMDMSFSPEREMSDSMDEDIAEEIREQVLSEMEAEGMVTDFDSCEFNHAYYEERFDEIRGESVCDYAEDYDDDYDPYINHSEEIPAPDVNSRFFKAYLDAANEHGNADLASRIGEWLDAQSLRGH